MTAEFTIKALVGLLPVLAFLGFLVYLDSYKLLRLKTLVAVIAAGGAVALLAWVLNGALLPATGLDFAGYSRYVAPLVEEALKALIVVYLFRTHRVGFLIDAAILGFAVGAGFAMVENFFILQVHGDARMTVWFVRGFGTAIMHGGVTAIFALVSQALTERQMQINPLRYLPGLGLAAVLHAVFNHFPVTPVLQALGTAALLPPALALVFDRSARALHDWLELDFDADARLIRMITSGEFPDSKVGRFLADLKTKFDGPVVADMLCYLRVYTELAIRAKAALIARENGLELPVGERTRARFEELRYLERSIGRTGRLAMRPFLQMERKDLWQMHVLARHK
ncbi:MAG: PrsW family glutamic-type intramembrane protease [Xanthomonadales bacterium]